MCYSSLIITELNAPLKGTRITEFSKDILCENQSHLHGENVDQLYIKMFEGMMDSFNDSEDWEGSDCFAVLSPPTQYQKQNFLRDNQASFFYSLLSLIKEKALEVILFAGFSTEAAFYLQFISRKQRYVPREIKALRNHSMQLEAEIEAELSKCGKSIYYDSLENLNREKEYLDGHYPRKKFYKSSESILTRLVGWTTTSHVKSNFMMSLQIMFQAGLLQEIKSLGIYGAKLKRAKATIVMNRNISNFEPVTLQDSISTIFVILVVLLAFSIGILLLECLTSIFKNHVKHTARLKRTFWKNWVCLRKSLGKIISKVNSRKQ